MEGNYAYLLFIGHRDAPDGLLPALSDAAEKRITEHGVDDLIPGGVFSDYRTLAGKNAFLDLNDYLDLVPDLRTHYTSQSKLALEDCMAFPSSASVLKTRTRAFSIGKICGKPGDWNR